MNILSNKYISEDEILNILYSTSPKDILSFTKITKVTRRLSSTSTFWHTYLNESQSRYNKLMLRLAEEGELKLFKKLWPVTKIAKTTKLISEAKILKPAFETSVLNNHDEMADYLYVLDALWINSKFRSLGEYTDDFISLIKSMDNFWNTMPIIDNIKKYREIIDENKFIVVLQYTVIHNHIEYAKELIMNYAGNARNVAWEKVLACAKSMSVVNKLKSVIGTSPPDMLILQCAVEYGNYKIAKYYFKFLNIRNRYQTRHLFRKIINNKYAQVFFWDFLQPFIKEYININMYYHNVGNKIVFDKLFDILNDELRTDMILDSPFIFKPYEYVELIMETMGCVSRVELLDIVNRLLEYGEYYRASILREELIVCGVNEV